MQTTVSGKQGILPALSRALHLESGIMGKRRLSDSDDYADFINNFRLALFLFRFFLPLKNLRSKAFCDSLLKLKLRR